MVVVKVLQYKSCVLPWISHSIGNLGKVLPCNRFGQNQRLGHQTIGLGGKDLSEYHHSMPQRNFVKGKFPEHCNACAYEEQNGIQSMRQIYNKIYEDVDTSKIQKLPPRYLEMSFGNINTIASRHSSPKDSTRWNGVARYLHNEIKYNIDTFNEWRLEVESIDVDLSEIDRLRFTGEPLQQSNHEEFLANFVKQNPYSGRVTVYYETNGFDTPSDKVLELWDHLGSVQICFTVDGVGKMNEYIKPPSNWNQVEDNIRWYKQLQMNNLHLHGSSKISLLNALDIKNIWLWIKDHKIKNWHYKVVGYPSIMSISNAPTPYKQQVKEHLTNCVFDTHQLEKTIDRIQNPDVWKDFKKVNKTVDKYWNTSLKYVNESLWSYT